MPDDSALTDVLDRVAAAGQAAARTEPPSVLRRRATRRTARNGSIVATVAVLAVVAGLSVASGTLGTATRDQGPSRSTATAPAGPVPTQLAPPSTSGLNRRHIDPSMLVTQEQVSRNLGSSWPWTAAPASDGSKPLTPCQATAGDDTGTADRRTAMSQAVTGGRSGDDTFSQLLEEYPDSASARRAYASAVDWFASCNGLGVDQTDDPRSVARLAAAHTAVHGVDDMRIIVRMRAQDGEGSTTSTLATAVRAGNLVTVLAWDVTVDDSSGADESGFVALSWQLASQLADAKKAHTVLGDVLFSPDDPAVKAVLGGDASTDHDIPGAERNSVLRVDPFCHSELVPQAAGTEAAGGSQITGPNRLTLVEDVAVYPSVEAAGAAADAAIADGTYCPPVTVIPGSRRTVAVDAGPNSGAWTSTLSDSPHETRLAAVVSYGPLVAYLTLDNGDVAISADEVRALVDAAAARLVRAAGD